jgi:hypothetical protein
MSLSRVDETREHLLKIRTSWILPDRRYEFLTIKSFLNDIVLVEKWAALDAF